MKIILLLLLYMSQGLPFGFQATALPVYLRSQGISLATIGLAGALSLPWMLKALWAPFIDRWGYERIGRRKSWILPLQILLILTMYSTSRINPTNNLHLLLLLVFVMNFLASVQDIAVDGLAVDILGDNELGPGNAAQVAGYKTGMLFTGGFLLWLSSIIGWRGYFLVAAFLAFIPLLLIIPYKEFSSNNKTSYPSFPEIFLRAKPIFTSSGGLWFILFIGTYKAGEALIDCMFKPFLIDKGFSPSQIGLWVGTWGMIASLSGSLAGGLMCRKLSLMNSLRFALILRLIPLSAEVFLTLVTISPEMVIAITISEHFCGGLLTTILFAFMMSRVDHRIAATNYTILASIEVLGKSPGVWLSGFLAEITGYTLLFFIGFILSCLSLIFVFPVKRIYNYIFNVQTKGI